MTQKIQKSILAQMTSLGDATDLIEKLKKYFSIKEEYLAVILYGSFAKGKATAQSDIDIAVYKDHQLSPDEKMHLIEDLSLEFNRAIDVVDLHNVHVPLSQEILTQGKYLKLANLELKESMNKKMIYEATDFLPIKRRIQTEN